MVQCDNSGARVSTPDTRVQPTDPAPFRLIHRPQKCIKQFRKKKKYIYTFLFECYIIFRFLRRQRHRHAPFEICIRGGWVQKNGSFDDGWFLRISGNWSDWMWCENANFFQVERPRWVESFINRPFLPFSHWLDVRYLFQMLLDIDFNKVLVRHWKYQLKSSKFGWINQLEIRETVATEEHNRPETNSFNRNSQLNYKTFPNCFKRAWYGILLKTVWCGNMFDELKIRPRKRHWKMLTSVRPNP